MSGLYIHVPFCRRKCIYCDFFSVGERFPGRDGYVDSILLELKSRLDEISEPVETLYIGGGTPSLLTDDEFTRLAHSVNSILGNLYNVSEFTIEVNPDDVTPRKAETWKRGGVNRVSMGVQSLIDSELKTIGRRHNARQAIEAANLLKKYFDNISLDIIFGLPQQTLDTFHETLDAMLSLEPQHLSAYSLMYEPGTALTRMRDKGMIDAENDDLSLSLYRELIRRVKDAGYEHYEISNFAKPGFRSRHNSSYWDGTPYIGLGPSAHSYDGKNTRRANSATFNLNDYETDLLDDNQLREEMVMTRLRTKEGLNLAEYEARFGIEASKRLRNSATKHLDNNMLKLTQNTDGTSSLSLTEDGIMISDTIIVDLI